MSQVGLTLYTVREDCARDFEGTLRAVAEMGYEGVEVFSLHGHEPQALAAVLAELGLPVGPATPGSRRSRTTWTASRRRRRCWAGPPVLSLSSADTVGDPALPGRLADATAPPRPTASTSASTTTGRGHAGSTRARPSRPPADRATFLEVDLGWVWWAGHDPVLLVERPQARAAGAREGLRGPAASASAPGRRAMDWARVAPRRGGGRRRVAARGAGPVRRPAARRRTALVRRPAARSRHEGRHRRLRRHQRQYANAPHFDSYESSPAPTSDRAMAETLAAEHGYEAPRSTSCSRTRDRRRAQPHAAGRARRPSAPGARGGQARLHREAARHRGAEERGAPRRGRPARLRIGCAPDIFLGSAYQAARAADRRRGDRRADLGERDVPRRRPGALAPEPGHLLPRRRRPAARHGALLPHVVRGAARPGDGGDGVRDDARRPSGGSRSGRARGRRSGPRPRRTRRPCSSSRRARARR